MTFGAGEEHFLAELPPQFCCSVNVVLSAVHYNFSSKVYSSTQSFHLIRVLQHISCQFIIQFLVCER